MKTFKRVFQPHFFKAIVPLGKQPNTSRPANTQWRHLQNRMCRELLVCGEGQPRLVGILEEEKIQ